MTMFPIVFPKIRRHLLKFSPFLTNSKTAHFLIFQTLGSYFPHCFKNSYLYFYIFFCILNLHSKDLLSNSRLVYKFSPFFDSYLWLLNYCISNIMLFFFISFCKFSKFIWFHIIAYFHLN